MYLFIMTPKKLKKKSLVGGSHKEKYFYLNKNCFYSNKNVKAAPRINCLWVKSISVSDK